VGRVRSGTRWADRRCGTRRLLGHDAHKSLNVSYDCGVVAVRDTQALRSAMGLNASYLLKDADGSGDPSQRVPELSRRAARRVAERLIADGRVWMSGSSWHGRDVVRISVSNWPTDADDVTTAVEAVRTAVEAVRRLRSQGS
jgi:hypothetical protein